MAREDVEKWRTVLVPRLKRPVARRDARRGEERLAGHERGDRRGERAPIRGVVRQAERHQQRAEIRIAEPERPEAAAVVRDLGRRVRGPVDDRLHRGDEHGDVGAHRIDVERTVGTKEPQQVQRGQVARGVVEEQILPARIARADRPGRLARIPGLDRRGVLDAGIAARPRTLRHAAQHVARTHALDDLARRDGTQPPCAIVAHRIEKRIRNTHAEVRVLERNAPVRLPVESALVPRRDERTRLVLFPRLRVDELEHVRVIDVEDLHLRRAPRAPARLHGTGERVVPAHEADRTRRTPAPRNRLAARTQRAEVGPAPRPALKDQPFDANEIEDRAHVVAHGKDETCRALRLRIDPDVEPHRRVEGRALAHEDLEQPRLVAVATEHAGDEPLAGDPVGQRPADPRDHGAHRSLARLPAEVAARDDLQRRVAPVRGRLDVVEREDERSGFVVDRGGPAAPRNRVERMHSRVHGDSGRRHERRTAGLSIVEA